MWTSLFTVVLAFALACGWASVIMGSAGKPARSRARRRTARVRG